MIPLMFLKKIFKSKAMKTVGGVLGGVLGIGGGMSLGLDVELRCSSALRPPLPVLQELTRRRSSTKFLRTAGRISDWMLRILTY